MKFSGGLGGLGPGSVSLLVVGLAVGCAESKATTPGAPPPPTVLVAPVVRQDVPLYIEAVSALDGYVDADIRARVRGVLQAQRYKDGATVQKGQLLFTIEPSEFQIAAD
jgi:multidrug efflux pump subunit AcrA (membrane-fusion protein)